MKKTEIKKLAKKILTAATINGEISFSALSKITAVLKHDGSQKAIAVLETLEKILLEQEKENQLVIESPFPLEQTTTDTIRLKYEKLFAKKLELVEKENKELIGGIRISSADFVWENSIMSNLTQLKGVITNE